MDHSRRPSGRVELCTTAIYIYGMLLY